MFTSLFSSHVRAKVIAAFFLSPGEKYNAWELAQKLKVNYSAVWKELARLERLGILISEPQGNSKEYQVNNECPIAPELRSIILKTEGAGLVIREKLLEMGRIHEAYIYGSYASGDADTRSDLDLMIIGDVDLDQLAPVITQLEKKLNRSINYVIYSEDEWNEKRTTKDSFWENVTNDPKISLIGENHDL
ncbi:MAG: nucleotidyltransferase domain-containing protein [Anaerolineales bacterium]|jgi:predicted nucleotidyltransferase